MSTLGSLSNYADDDNHNAAATDTAAAEPGRLEALAGVRAEYLDTALDAITREYGSFEGYVEKACGLTKRRREQLSAHLLD